MRPRLGMLCLLFGFVGVACSLGGTCAGTRAEDVTVCWYLSPATRCIDLRTTGYGAGLVTDSDDGTKSIEWTGSFFRGYHILTGPVLIDLNPDRSSKGLVRPLQARTFFPASTAIEFYFTIRAPNRGWLLKNRDPIRVSCPEVRAIPPRGSVFTLTQPVDFFRAEEVNDPRARPVVMLKKARIFFDPPEATFSFPIWVQTLIVLVAIPLILLLTRITAVIRLLTSGAPADWVLLRRSTVWPGVMLSLFVASMLWTFRSLSIAQLFAAVHTAAAWARSR